MKFWLNFDFRPKRALTRGVPHHGISSAAMPCDRVSQSKDALPPGQLDGQPSIPLCPLPLPFGLREGPSQHVAPSLCFAIIILEAEKKKEEVIARSDLTGNHAIIFYIPQKTSELYEASLK